MKVNLLKISIIFLILAACTATNSPIPVATDYPISKQHKMQDAHHWDVLAKDLARRLKRTMAITFPNATVKPPLVVKLTGDQEQIPFAKAFNNLLISRLVQQKMVVLDTNSGYADSLMVDYNMQVIRHQYPRLLSTDDIWEVLLTTSVSKGQQYIFRDSRVYYINDGDSDHYERNMGTKTYKVHNQ